MAHQRLIGKQRFDVFFFFFHFFTCAFIQLVFLMIMVIMCVIIEKTNGIYVDCQARCWFKTGRERNRDTLQMCRDQCEILKLLEQEDAREGKYYRYRQF